MTWDSLGLEYRPALEDASDFLHASSQTRFLLLGGLLKSGEGLPDGFEKAGECRHWVDPASSLPTGSYQFRLDRDHVVMLVTEGAPPGLAERGRPTPDQSSSLENAARWFEYFWEEATPIPQPRFGVHSDVTIQPDGSEAVVRSRHYSEGSWQYGVRSGGKTQYIEERFLAEFDAVTDPTDWILDLPGTAREITATLTRAKLEEQLTDTVYSFRASRTLFMPYQFRPVIKMLRTGTRRLLIADEVGMGKTIEAGLVWSEFEARGQADRVLVVCPSGLVDKWQTEMRERFNLDAQVLKRDGLGDLLDRVETDRFPRRYHAICSLQLLRSWEHLERLNDLSPHFDMIVVDEAHALRNTDTLSFALGSLLSDWADILLFLSATPLNLGNDDLFNLLRLIDPGEFFDKHTLQVQLHPNAVLSRIYRGVADRVGSAELRSHLQSIGRMTYGPVLAERQEFKELDRLLGQDERTVADAAEIRRLCLELNTLSTVVTRTRRAEIDEQRPVREPRDIGVELSVQERGLYDAVHRWQVARAAAHNMPLHFIGQMPLRLAGSCLPAMRDQILRRHSGGAIDDVLDEDRDDEESSEADPWEAPPPYAVSAALSLGEVDTKFDAFLGALDEMVRPDRPVLVFTFSRPVIAYLHRRLRNRLSVEVLHGDVSPLDRRQRISGFRDGKYDVMLATRVASEGLDFEFCGAVVNYDLPWNPMEVEQRIGRIDRFGQLAEKVYVLNFTSPGTIETDIIHRIHQRIGVFVDSIGELEPILQDEFSDIKRIAFDFSLSARERERRLDAALLAVKNKAMLQQDFDDSTDILNVLDHASMDGFESEVMRAGHYVGQPELARLIEDWAATSKGARCRLSDDRQWLHLRGDAKLEGDLRQVQTAGERSSSEVDRLAVALRNEIEIHLCLDQEVARHQGADLLTASHMLVRAALKAKRGSPIRFGAARIKSVHVAPGNYLVLAGIAKWNGLRPAAELWTAACDRSGQSAENEIGAELFTALAEAELEPVGIDAPRWSPDHVHECEDVLRKRLVQEQQRRETDNAVQVEARLVSLRDSHYRKIRGLRERIASLAQEGKMDAIRLFESQMRVQERRLHEAERQLEDRARGSLSLEYVALCSLEVAP